MCTIILNPDSLGQPGALGRPASSRCDWASWNHGAYHGFSRSRLGTIGRLNRRLSPVISPLPFGIEPPMRPMIRLIIAGRFGQRLGNTRLSMQAFHRSGPLDHTHNLTVADNREESILMEYFRRRMVREITMRLHVSAYVILQSLRNSFLLFGEHIIRSTFSRESW